MDNNVLLIDTFMFGFSTMGLIHAVADTYLKNNRLNNLILHVGEFAFICGAVSYYGYRVYYRK